jgi:hypothetical protein
MSHQGYANINTGQKEYRGDVLVTGFMPLAGTGLNLSISAGYIDGREVLADTSVTVGDSDGAADFAGWLISEDGAGAFVVTNTALGTHATAVLALAAAKALDVPAGDTALFVGVSSNSLTPGLLKDDSVKGRVLGDDIAADETITL